MIQVKQVTHLSFAKLLCLTELQQKQKKNLKKIRKQLSQTWKKQFPERERKFFKKQLTISSWFFSTTEAMLHLCIESTESIESILNGAPAALQCILQTVGEWVEIGSVLYVFVEVINHFFIGRMNAFSKALCGLILANDCISRGVDPCQTEFFFFINAPVRVLLFWFKIFRCWDFFSFLDFGGSAWGRWMVESLLIFLVEVEVEGLANRLGPIILRMKKQE